MVKAFLLFLNLSAGFLNYLFLILLAKRLPLHELGQINSYLAGYSVLSAAAAAVQYRVVLSRELQFKLKNVIQVSICMLGLTFLSTIFFAQRNMLMSLIFSSLPALLCLMGIAGLFQRHQRFALFGCVGMFLAILKTGLAFQAESSIDFSLTLPVSVGLSLFLFLIILVTTQKKFESESHSTSPVTETDGFNSGWSAAWITALAYGWLPAFDILYVKYFFSSIETGEYSKLLLFSKILFFVPLTLLQITLPQYSKIFREETSTQELQALRKQEFLGLCLCYLGVLFFAITGPFLARQILGLGELSAFRVTAVCLSAVPLYGLLAAIQTFTAAGNLKKAVFWLMSTFIPAAVFFLIPRKSIELYLTVSTIVNTILGFCASHDLKRVLRIKMAEGGGNPLPLPPSPTL